MIELIEFKGEKYPAFQSTGNAARFIMPFAKEICKGVGYDIGCNRIEWALPGAIPIDPVFISHDVYFKSDNEIEGLICKNGVYALKYDIKPYNALNLPDFIGQVDYIFSSHCLEHLENPWDALDYWHKQLKREGVLFLYLPDFSQKYWRPWHNKKHVHCLTPDIIKQYLQDTGWQKIFVSGIDLNNSFTVIAEK